MFSLFLDGPLANDRVRKGATVVYAGSEASRGIPMMRAQAPSVPEGYATIDDALWAVATGGHIRTGVNDIYEYGLVKLMATAWMWELAHRHGGRLRALSVSPGMTAGTNVTSGMPAPMRVVMNWVMMPMMKLFGMAHDATKSAGRYIQGLTDTRLNNGGFYGSPGRSLTGALTLQSPKHQPLLIDDDFTRAVGRLMDRVAKAPAPAALASS